MPGSPNFQIVMLGGFALSRLTPWLRIKMSLTSRPRATHRAVGHPRPRPLSAIRCWIPENWMTMSSGAPSLLEGATSENLVAADEGLTVGGDHPFRTGTTLSPGILASSRRQSASDQPFDAVRIDFDGTVPPGRNRLCRRTRSGQHGPVDAMAGGRGPGGSSSVFRCPGSPPSTALPCSPLIWIRPQSSKLSLCRHGLANQTTPESRSTL